MTGLNTVHRSTPASTDGRPVLVLGAAGQLGETIAATFPDRWHTVPLVRSDLDLCDSGAVRQRVRDLQPWAIVNCAAWNAVDAAEEQPQPAFDINAFAVRTLARAAAETGALLVHYSTDFVFDGETDRPYTEDDRPGPRSAYAASKLVGEWFAADASAHYVLRVESLFGGLTRRKSSLDRIIAAIAAGGPVRVFTDRVVSPSYVPDIAAATAALIEARPPSGVYHCVNTGAATWHDIAQELARQLDVRAELVPIRMEDAALPATRPRYCALSNEKLRRAAYDMPTWQDALRRALATGQARDSATRM